MIKVSLHTLQDHVLVCEKGNKSQLTIDAIHASIVEQKQFAVEYSELMSERTRELEEEEEATRGSSYYVLVAVWTQIQGV